MEERDAIFRFVIGIKELGRVELKVLEEFVGCLFWPLHEVKVIVDVRSNVVDEEAHCS